MFKVKFLVSWIIFTINCYSVSSIFLVVPEDVPTALVGIYGFAPKLVFGKDHRVGFGFRLGNHADLQVVYELGPQEVTRPLAPLKTRSAVSYRQRIIRQRPFIRFLLRSGLLQDLQEISYKFDVVHNDNDVDNDPGPR